MTKKRTRSPEDSARVPFLDGLYIVAERVPARDRFPFNLGFVPGLDITFDSPVTFFVGENGSGKSTLLEAIADLCGYNLASGGKDDHYQHHEDAGSELARALRPRFRRRPRDGFFFRAETLVNFANLLDERRRDPDFLGDPYMRYGGGSLHVRSHGEAFLSVFQNRVHDGLFLVDEPEAALSPQRQLSLLYQMFDLVGEGQTQFIIATHSPVLLTFPGSVILSFDNGALERVSLEETKHYQITKGILDNPERYWKHLRMP